MEEVIQDITVMAAMAGATMAVTDTMVAGDIVAAMVIAVVAGKINTTNKATAVAADMAGIDIIDKATAVVVAIITVVVAVAGIDITKAGAAVDMAAAMVIAVAADKAVAAA